MLGGLLVTTVAIAAALVVVLGSTALWRDNKTLEVFVTVMSKYTPRSLV